MLRCIGLQHDMLCYVTFCSVLTGVGQFQLLVIQCCGILFFVICHVILAMLSYVML